MYTDAKAPEAFRGQAQGLLVFLTQGIGMFFGYRIMAAGKLDFWGYFEIPLNGRSVNTASKSPIRRNSPEPSRRLAERAR